MRCARSVVGLLGRCPTTQISARQTRKCEELSRHGFLPTFRHPIQRFRRVEYLKIADVRARADVAKTLMKGKKQRQMQFNPRSQPPISFPFGSGCGTKVLSGGRSDQQWRMWMHNRAYVDILWMICGHRPVPLCVLWIRIWMVNRVRSDHDQYPSPAQIDREIRAAHPGRNPKPHGNQNRVRPLQP